MPAPNTRVQRTRSSPSALRSPLTRRPLGGRRHILAIAVLVATAMLIPDPVTACSCGTAPPPLQALADSRAVFSGNVVKIEDQLSMPKRMWAVIRIGAAHLFGSEEPEFSPRWYGLAVTLEVDQTWKGEIPS
jgi:hypothetical protein